MAKNITQRIVLSGAEEIRAALKAIGENGSAAFKKLADANAANKGLAAIGVNLKDLAAKLKNFGTASKTAATDAVAFGGAVGSALARVTGLSAGLGVAASKLVNAFKNVGNDAEELQINADAANLSTEAYERLTNALAQNGVGQEEAGKALDKVSKFIRAAADQTDDYNKKVLAVRKEQAAGTIGWAEAAQKLRDLKDGMGEAAKIADRYGIRLKESNGQLRNVRDVLLDFGQGMKDADDKTLAAADALTVFGKAGRKIGQAAGQGRAELEKLEITMGGLAPSLKLAAQKAVQGMDDAFDNIGITTKSLKREILAVFAPDVTSVVSSFTNLLAGNRDKFLALATTIRDTLRPAIDDLLAKLNSPEAGEQLIAGFNAAIDVVKALGTALKDFIIPAFVAIKKGADEVALKINEVFGTKLTGGVLLAGLVLAKFTGLLKVLSLGIQFVVSSGRLLVAAFQALLPVLRILLPYLLTPAAAIIALGIAIGILVGLVIRNWDTIKAKTIEVFNNIIGIFTQFPGNLGRIWEAAKALTAEKWEAIKAYLLGVWTAITQPFRDFPGNLAIVWAFVMAGISAAWEGIKAYFFQLVAAIVQPFKDFPGNLAIVWDAVKAGVIEKWDAIKAYFVGLWGSIKGLAQEYFDYLIANASAPFTAIKNAARDMWTSVKQWFADLIVKAKELLGLQSQASAGGGSGGGSAQRNAAGGHIRGAGTGTSDSILSWLSNGEFVVKARAVKHYGPNILHAINNMRLPRFADGGMARVAANLSPARIPRFAGGGMAPRGGGGGRPLVLQLGDQQFGGMTANANAVDALGRYASAKAVRSAGRKPEWYKG